jgi:hypothetical protein
MSTTVAGTTSPSPPFVRTRFHLPQGRDQYRGIYRSHARRCDWHLGQCSFSESYQATVWSRRDGKLIRKHSDKLTATKTWREDACSAVPSGKMCTASKLSHASPVITQGRYTHVDRRHPTAAASQLDTFLAETVLKDA